MTKKPANPLTRSKDVVPNLDFPRPTIPLQKRTPHLLDRRALRPGNNNGNPQRGIHRDDDKPYKRSSPARRDAQHGEGERRLAPQRREDGKGAGQIRIQKKDTEIPEVELSKRPTEPEVDAGRDEGAVCNEGDLGGGTCSIHSPPRWLT